MGACAAHTPARRRLQLLFAYSQMGVLIVAIGAMVQEVGTALSVFVAITIGIAQCQQVLHGRVVTAPALCSCLPFLTDTRCLLVDTHRHLLLLPVTYRYLPLPAGRPRRLSGQLLGADHAPPRWTHGGA